MSIYIYIYVYMYVWASEHVHVCIWQPAYNHSDQRTCSIYNLDLDRMHNGPLHRGEGLDRLVDMVVVSPYNLMLIILHRSSIERCSAAEASRCTKCMHSSKHDSAKRRCSFLRLCRFIALVLCLLLGIFRCSCHPPDFFRSFWGLQIIVLLRLFTVVLRLFTVVLRLFTVFVF